MRLPAPEGATNPTTRLDSLTGARFLAALGVFIYHAAVIFPPEGVFGTALAFAGRDGSVGVDFFFALSGFVLAWSWRSGTSTMLFYRRRFARIAPAYWVALGYGLVWVMVLYHDALGASIRTIPAILGVQAWFPDPSIHFAANGVEWSVSAELFFYALFPVLIALAYRRGGRTALLIAGVALAGVAPVLLPALLPGEIVGWALNIFPLVRLGEFVCGLLLAVALREGKRVPVRPRVAVGLFLVCYVLRPMAPPWVPLRAVFVVAILLVIGSLAQADLRGRRTILARRIPVRLGEWSYCFYLVHQMTSQIMLFVCAKVVPGKALGPVWIVAALAVSLLLAALLHHVVERPLERRLRGSGRRSASSSETVREEVRPVPPVPTAALAERPRSVSIDAVRTNAPR